jgi:hypothetical protein
MHTVSQVTARNRHGATPPFTHGLFDDEGPPTHYADLKVRVPGGRCKPDIIPWCIDFDFIRRQCGLLLAQPEL